MNTRTIVIAAALVACSVAQAQTTYTLNFDKGRCNSANGCGVENYPAYSPGEPAVAPNPEPMFYPQVYCDYITGLSIPATFHTGSVRPMVPTPQLGTGSGTCHWTDGGPNSGVITIPQLECRFEVFPAWPVYAVTCSGTDPSTGNSVSFTHELYLFGPLRFGYWNWPDNGGPMVISVQAGD